MFYSKSDNKLRKSMFFISLKLFNYIKNSERNLSMLKMLSLIVLHIGIHVQLFKRNPNFTTRVPVNRLVDPHVRVDIHVQMLNLCFITINSNLHLISEHSSGRMLYTIHK